jgi:hypothetical protein
MEHARKAWEFSQEAHQQSAMFLKEDKEKKSYLGFRIEKKPARRPSAALRTSRRRKVSDAGDEVRAKSIRRKSATGM